MSVQAVQLALPSMQVDLAIANVDLQWLVRCCVLSTHYGARNHYGTRTHLGIVQISSYSVAFGGLLLLFGRLADIVRIFPFLLNGRYLLTFSSPLTTQYGHKKRVSPPIPPSSLPSPS